MDLNNNRFLYMSAHLIALPGFFVTVLSQLPQSEIKMAEKRSMCSSPLYKSTLDDLVVEDKAVNVVSSTEHLEVFFCVHFPFLSLSHQFSSQWSTLIVLAEES